MMTIVESQEPENIADQELIRRYNYDEFVPHKFMPWLNFEASPSLGERAPDFPLWTPDEEPTSLKAVWSASDYTIVEFGSFT